MSVSRDRCRSVGRAFLTVAAACAIGACSSPTQFETTPEFLGLAPANYTLDAATSGNQLPDDSCPRTLPKVVKGTRRTLSEIGATIELPADTREIAHAFGARPGAAFLSPTLGLIAVGYDSDLPTMLRNFGLGERTGRSPIGNFSRWCPMTIKGVRATMFVDQYALLRVGSREYLFGNDIVITATSPAGRRVNIRISSNTLDVESDGIYYPAVFHLIAAVSGMQW